MIFLRLPPHLHDRICKNLAPKDRIKLSTCHRDLFQCGNIENVIFEVRSKQSLASFCTWLRNRPTLLKYLSIFDSKYLLESCEELRFDFEQVLESCTCALEELVICCGKSFEESIPKIPTLRMLTVVGGPFMQDICLSPNTNLTSLHLYNGLDNSVDDLADLEGIADVRNLEELLVHNHDGYLCLCLIPNLRKLKRLEIIGTSSSCHVIRDIHQIRYLTDLEHLVLDSRTSSAIGNSFLSVLKNLKTFDLSRKHANYKSLPAITIPFHNRDFLRDVCAMPKLTTFGCRDVILDDTFFSSTIETLYMTLHSIIPSLHAGFDFSGTPALSTLVVDFACSHILDAETTMMLATALREHPRIQVVLHKPMDDSLDRFFENRSLTMWMYLAAQCPAVRFRIE